MPAPQAAVQNIHTDTAHVYTHYTWRAMPEHPGAGSWTRFVCLSDTHLRTDVDVPDGDVLIHCGDLTRRGGLHEIQQTIEWIAKMPHPVKIIIAGNHDMCLDPATLNTLKPKQAARIKHEWKEAPEYIHSAALKARGVVYLQSSSTRLELEHRIWNIHGDPGTPRYGMPAFQYDTEHAQKYWDSIPPRTEILVTHGPPAKVLDETLSEIRAGCSALATKVATLSALRLHVFGHVHEAFGAHVDPRTGLVSVNCAVKWQGQPVIVDLLN